MRFFTILIISLFVLSCGTTNKKPPAQVEYESEAPEVEEEEEEEVVESPTEETETEETIDLGLEGSSNSKVKISTSDSSVNISSGSSSGCATDDPECLNKVARSKIAQMRKKCGKDKKCIQRASEEAAANINLQQDGEKTKLEVD